MHPEKIQQAVANGVPPLMLCKLVSSAARSRHQPGDPLEYAIVRAIHVVSERVATVPLNACVTPAHIA